MRFYAFPLLLLLSGTPYWVVQIVQTHAAEGPSAKVEYRCPMHPNVHSDHPGDCPICHMQLNRVVSNKKDEAAPTPTESPSSPAPSASKADRKIKFYRNPMDPSIHSDVPMKDSMGMDYVPVYEDARPAVDNGKVDGHASFQISPEQLRLSGVRLVRTERRDLEQELRVPGRSLGGGRVSFQVFEQDLPLVVSGQMFRAFSPSVPGEVLDGKITSVESILDPMTRTTRVNGTMTSRAGLGLRTEASLSGVIQIKHASILTIPEEAVLHSGSRELVFVSSPSNDLSPREVSLGARAGGLVEIKSGLHEGEVVSSGPNFLLDSESRIQATYDSSDH